MTTSAATDPGSTVKTPNAITVTGFFADEQFDFLARSAIGYAAKGVMDVGEVFATIARITDSDADSWYAAWRQTAGKLHDRATAALVAGHVATASTFFLAAAEAYSQANAVADRQHDQTLAAPTFDLQIQCWEAFIDSTDGRAERITVPYQPVPIPGYLFRPDTSDTPRPTLVMTNGSEGSLSGLWSWGVSTALARGWNAFIYDGPGQQTMLFHHNVPFRADWEAVITPIVDSLTGRADVDASRAAGLRLQSGRLLGAPRPRLRAPLRCGGRRPRRHGRLHQVADIHSRRNRRYAAVRQQGRFQRRHGRSRG